MILAAAIVLAAVVGLAARQIAGEIRATREEIARGRVLTILRMFAPGIEAARSDPRALLTWHPLARVVQKMFPEQSAALDAAAGGRFPFTADQIRAAHAQWTTEWLAWERAHDATYKDRAMVAEHELTASGGAPAARARLDAIEREKLDLYQRRYQEYIQVGKALQSLMESAASEPAPDRGRPLG